jgi:hypothetical protein
MFYIYSIVYAFTEVKKNCFFFLLYALLQRYIEQRP